jgi:putative peptidoglycan lipid II flippase
VAIYNIGLIGGLLVTLAVPKIGIYGPTYGVLVAALLQVGVQIPGLWKQGVRYSFVWNIRHPGLREVMRLLVPNALGVGVASIGFIMNTAFASYLPDKASLSAMHNANMLYQLPIALISQAIGQALLPYLVAQAAAGRFMRLRYTALKVMGASLALTIPAAILLAVLGGPLIRLLFQHGAFTKHSSSLTELALIGFVVGLPGTAAAELISRGFYALKDTKTPLFMDTLTLGVRYGLTLFLLNLLINNKLIILAIPLSTSLAATFQAVLVAVILFWRLNRAVKNDKGLQRLQQRRMRKQVQAQEGKE